MRTLYRAICFCTDRAESCEKLVFFEVEPSDSPVKKLVTLMMEVWGVTASAIGYYNLSTEDELHQQSISRNENSALTYNTVEYERQLLEIGYSPNGERIYPALSDWPIMLVSPRTHDRLVKALLSLEKREAVYG